MTDLVTTDRADVTDAALLSPQQPLPLAIASDRKTLKAFFSFFTDNIRNANTREAYHRNAIAFLRWCDEQALALPVIESFHVSTYVELLCRQKADSTVKQYLASIKMLYDWLLIRQVVTHNPAAAVRGPKLVIHRGKTPVLDEDTARSFFAAIDTSHVVGKRDAAFVAIMTYALPRVSAVCGMLVGDYYRNGKTWWCRFSEKGGKHHEVPAHHKLVEYLDAYLDAAGIADDKKSPLFRSPRGQSRRLTERPIRRENALRMVKRRGKDAGLEMEISNHTFRGTGITNYMSHGGALKYAQDMAAHADPRTTRLYDRSGDIITLEEVERIHI